MITEFSIRTNTTIYYEVSDKRFLTNTLAVSQCEFLLVLSVNYDKKHGKELYEKKNNTLFFSLMNMIFI